MKQSIDEKIGRLELHLENLSHCHHYEDFIRCQVAFVTLLIAELKAQRTDDKGVKDFVDNTEFLVTKTIGFDAAGHCTYLIPERGHCVVCDEAFAEMARGPAFKTQEQEPLPP